MLLRRNLKPLAIPLVNPGEVNLSGNASPLSVDFGCMNFFIVISVNDFQTVHSTSVQDNTNHLLRLMRIRVRMRVCVRESEIARTHDCDCTLASPAVFRRECF